MLVLEVGHENVVKTGRHLGAYGSATNLQEIFPIKLKLGKSQLQF